MTGYLLQMIDITLRASEVASAEGYVFIMLQSTQAITNLAVTNYRLYRTTLVYAKIFGAF